MASNEIRVEDIITLEILREGSRGLIGRELATIGMRQILYSFKLEKVISPTGMTALVEHRVLLTVCGKELLDEITSLNYQLQEQLIKKLRNDLPRVGYATFFVGRNGSKGVISRELTSLEGIDERIHLRRR